MQYNVSFQECHFNAFSLSWVAPDRIKSDPTQKQLRSFLAPDWGDITTMTTTTASGGNTKAESEGQIQSCLEDTYLHNLRQAIQNLWASDTATYRMRGNVSILTHTFNYHLVRNTEIHRVANEFLRI